MTQVRTLWLLRHAEAVAFAPGRRDLDRPLTPRGHTQAEAVGRWLADQPGRPSVVLCSPAVRTRETTAGLALGIEPTVARGIWDAGPDDLRAELATVDDDQRSVLVVGHGPGIPALVDGLTDRRTSDPDVVAELDRHFPTATLARIEVTGPWSALRPGRLLALHLER